MKTLATALTAALVLGGAAYAADSNERGASLSVSTKNVTKVETTAGELYSTRDLIGYRVSADTPVSVTLIPSSGQVDRPSRND
ncbi:MULTISPECIES: hypothetical protein [Gemmobacter]|jgi:hypothetical protein|uniref:Uncharacterized protein n=2 Tax=Gemmobacter TaxID=204456 RepID=A0A2T6B1Q0_9RHOB|nr:MULTISPECIES: hypothetical protein [Gemmobacter]OJY31651.1 MAG: hypothetical protein BGP11_08640 [Rhodobacterales bacterium 65-51]PTX49952.1 hypothetical protein C8N34_106133 [Gemmobacter caeni]TWJ01848.1 hypothetical protein IQ03_01499 [Gemmobacter caeni]GHC22171.1 hypothetical protein GCM10007291_21860 [Gemmobacter nanjingensis]